jgi:acyl CoA:acetate/3-ketoacid CoA transferase beta subunit
MTRGDVVAIALAEAFRGEGRVLASPMAPIARLAVRLAKATFAPELVLTDGVAHVIDLEDQRIGWMPYSRVFDTVWSGRRHVIMGATQLDAHGNQNLSCLGDHAHPRTQLLGVRGAPGNTVHHRTSYWVPDHSPRVFVPAVDFVSGLGTDHGAFGLVRVVTNLAVLDLGGPGGTMRLVSVHPGVTVDQVREQTGFPLAVEHAAGDVPTSRGPDEVEAGWLERLDPGARIRGTVA